MIGKKCSFCGNTTFSVKSVQYIYRHEGTFLVVNNVPCEQCDTCGEQYFAVTDLKKIESNFQKISSNSKQAKTNISVPVEEFAEI